MGFRNFRLNLLLRLAALLLNFGLLAWLLTLEHYWATCFILLLAAIGQSLELLRYVETSNRELVKFLKSIQYDDFSATYSLRKRGKSFDELYETFNHVVKKFLEIRADREAQYHYLHSIVHHIQIGLLIIDEKGEVLLSNSATQKLLHIHQLKNTSDIEAQYPAFAQALQQLKIGEKELLSLPIGEAHIQVAVTVAHIKMLGQTHRLISLQDIQSELEEKEMEAWQNLTRVLTHEIINSVTPITSLASTLTENFDKQFAESPSYESINIEEIEETHRAIKVIHKRAEGLVGFVTDFRNFTRVPSPKFRFFRVVELFEELKVLMQDDLKSGQIQFIQEIVPPDLQLNADLVLIEQILINLVKNSIQALAQQPEPRIVVSADTDESGRVVIRVKDNGVGISEEAKKNIFVPFFTTKKNGSGIGLSLSRQIMRMHGDTITLHSVPHKETVFTLRFP